jgi:hypothetical protein
LTIVKSFSAKFFAERVSELAANLTDDNSAEIDLALCRLKDLHLLSNSDLASALWEHAYYTSKDSCRKAIEGFWKFNNEVTNFLPSQRQLAAWLIAVCTFLRKEIDSEDLIEASKFQACSRNYPEKVLKHESLKRRIARYCSAHKISQCEAHAHIEEIATNLEIFEIDLFEKIKRKEIKEQSPDFNLDDAMKYRDKYFSHLQKEIIYQSAESLNLSEQNALVQFYKKWSLELESDASEYFIEKLKDDLKEDYFNNEV